MSAPSRLGAVLGALLLVLLAAAVNFWPGEERGHPPAREEPAEQQASAPDDEVADATAAAPALEAIGGPPRESTAVGPSPSPTPRPPVLRLALPRPVALDPAFAADAPSLDLVLALFEGLVGFDARGEPYGLQAERWTVSDDGRTYTFYLRPELRWSDGQPLTAADYVFAWRRNVAPAFGTPAAASLVAVQNAELIRRGRAAASTLGAAAPDDRTLVVTLEQPTAHFLRLVATPAFFPLPRVVVGTHRESWTAPEQIVTNGPFYLAEGGTELRLVRSETYWGERPALEGVRARLFPEGSDPAQVAAYDAGEVDLVHHLAAIGPATALLAEPARAADLRYFDEQSIVFLAINHRRPVFEDARVRRALGMALDRQLLVRLLGLPGQPSSSLQPDGVVGRAPTLWPEEDPAAARALLAEAGYPDGQGFPELTFSFNASPTWRALGEHLAARWRDTLGITVRLESLELGAFLRWRGTLDARHGDLYRGGWVGEYADPANWYNALWDSRVDAAQLNMGWRNPTFDALVRRAAATADMSHRAVLYAEAEALLADDYPAIPLYQGGRRVLVRPYVQGAHLDPAGGALLLRAISIAP